MPRLRILPIVGLLLLGACSGDDAVPVEDGAAVVSPPSSTAPAAVAPATTVASPEVESALADDAGGWSVEIDIEADGFDGGGVATTVGWSGDPASLDESDPFGEFGACSGWRERLAAYSVLVSGAADVDAVSVWTADRVTGPGIYDAQVRIERPGSAPIEASGTMTILDGLRAGEFVAFGPTGGRVEGTFACLGTEPPVPLEADDAGADVVEVFAQLRNGQAERIVGLATDGTFDVLCPAATGAAGGAIVGVEGDATIGGITAFELAGDGSITGRLRAGGATYEFDDVTLSLDEGGASGVFAAVSPEGVAVDGAFRCA